ncbi:MAG: DUF1501 domain-containing protein [Planctomycetaceae bacterium]
MFGVSSFSRQCDGVSRRQILQAGGLGLFGLNLPSLLRAEAAPQSDSKPMNCILLFTAGGMSNIDSFDLKPDAPVEYRGEFTPISSNVPGTQVCEHLPRMAQVMDKVCMIKSIVHGESGDHTAAMHYMLTGYPQRPDPTGQPVGSTIYPAFGSVIAKELGWRNSLPPNVLIGNKMSYVGAGYLSSKYDPLPIKADPNAKEFRVEDVSIPNEIGFDRTMRRRRMLDRLDGWQRQVESTLTRSASEAATGGAVLDRSEFYRQAFDLITSPAAKKAFDLQSESDAMRDRYGRTREGQATLLARRLVESGVRFVTVGFLGWDTHVKNFISLKHPLLPTLDQAYSALLEDLSQRGLLDSTLVICAGEFGRTPGVNGGAGRDHYAPCNAVGFSGAGTAMGHTVGKTDGKCASVVGQSNSTLDYAATIYRLLGIDDSQEYHTEDGRPVLINAGGKPIAGVIA